MEELHPARQSIAGIPGQVFLLLIMACGFGIFIYKALEAYRLCAKGQKENRLDAITERVKSLVIYVLAQLRVFHEPFAGFIHAFIFWGFLVLSIGYGNAIISAFWKGFHFPFTNTFAFLTIHNFFSLMVIVSVLLALFRRLVLRPKRLEYTPEAVIILCMILCIVSFDFVSEAFKAGAVIKSGQALQASVPLVTSFLGEQCAKMEMAPQAMISVSSLFWWLHMLLIFSFMAFLPFSKHFHIVTAAINVFLRNLKPPGQLSTLDLENSETYGVTAVKEYSWKSLFDLFVCTECGRCSESCPAYSTEKPLSPKKVIQDLKYHLKGQAKLLLEPPPPAREGEAPSREFPPIVGTALKEDEIWSCTTCAACMQSCPVFIEHVPKLVEVRRSLVLMESKFPQEVVLTFKNMENNFNPYGIGFGSRAEWCADLGVKILGEGQKAEYLFWVGCVGSFDDRNRKVSTAIVKLLKEAGVDFAILGAEEACCGDPARRIGNEYLYQTLAQQNIEQFKNHGVKKIITHCPHCFNVLRHEYGHLGAGIDVVHTTAFIGELVEKGKLVPREAFSKSVCYHDSCYLGRYNGVYDAPRGLLSAVPGAKTLEMGKKREDSFCCGAGGGRMWMEETLGKRINKARVEQAMAKSPEVIASNCPYCLTMLTDGVKDMNLEEKVKVMDLMEIMAHSCGEQKSQAGE
ncbi:MAG: (Fe-S)-binding protein [Candidatus Eremiobacteraeota bacterium]|nr:(Fe-S)-binding protein [Candidatus Eremiobacteraeota bacterium]